jgi:hypothetical protein
MQYEKMCCYRNRCVHRCSEPAVNEREAARLQGQIADLRKLEIEKLGILS